MCLKVKCGAKVCQAVWVATVLLMCMLLLTIYQDRKFWHWVPTPQSVPDDDKRLDIVAPAGQEQCVNEQVDKWQLWHYVKADVDCKTLFSEFLKYSEIKARPQETLNEEQRDAFTMQGRIELKLRFFNLTGMHKSTTETVWKREAVDNWIRKAKSNSNNFCTYNGACSLMYRALDKFPPAGMKALVVGSMNPWVEAIVLSRGAREVVTQEYALLRSEHPKISIMNVLVARNWSQYTDFDVAVTYSSLEHAGLARYGDSLCATCDILELKKLSCLIKPSGLLLLGVPIARDQLVFNAHRIYGPIRLAVLTTNWKVEHIVDYRSDMSPSQFAKKYFDDNSGKVRQPIMVLRNQRTLKCKTD